MQKVAPLFFIVLVTAFSSAYADSYKTTNSQEVNETAGSKEVAQSEQSEFPKIASNVRERVEKLLKAGFAMEKYRNTDTKGAMVCMEMMAKNSAEAEAVRSKAMTLPGLHYYNLKLASVEVMACVTCSDDAIEDCKNATESLANAE